MGRILINPYRNVNWEKDQQVKGNFHAHTTESDGCHYGGDSIERYKEAGYGIHCITDHDIPFEWPEDWNVYRERESGYINAWPWTKFEGTNLIEYPDVWYFPPEPYQQQQNVFGRNPETGEAYGILSLQGVEYSNIHHINGFDVDYSGEPGNTVDNALDSVSAEGGLALMAHPGRYDSYTDAWYLEKYDRHKRTLVGIEVYSKGDEGELNPPRELWDRLLNSVAKQNWRTFQRSKIWGYSNDDTHRMNQMFLNYNRMLLPELSVSALKRCMNEGRFYFSYEPEGNGSALAPQINNIEVNGNTITITTPDSDSIAWFINGVEAATGASYNFNLTTDFVIRATLENTHGVTLTQPFLSVLATTPEYRFTDGYNFRNVF